MKKPPYITPFQALRAEETGYLFTISDGFIEPSEDGDLTPSMALEIAKMHGHTLDARGRVFPQYFHGCENCTWMGSFDGKDYYHCCHGSLIVRMSSEPGDYVSMPLRVILTWDHPPAEPLATALFRYLRDFIPRETPSSRDPWEEDPEFTADDWQGEVSNNDTRLGYLDWVDHMREQSS